MSRRKWTEQEKHHARQVRSMLQTIQQNNDRITKLEAERDKYREHFVLRFNWWIKLIEEQKTPSLTWLVAAEAKFAQTVSHWHW